MELRRLLSLLAAAWLALGLTSCGDTLRGKGIAADAMDQFHDRFNAGDYDKIYDTADADFQGATTRTDFLKLLDAVHRKLGNYKTCASQSWRTNTFNGDTSVGLLYKTTFEKGTGDEDFTYRVSGQRATLRGYHIHSDKLITD